VQERSVPDAWMEDSLQIGLALTPDKASWAGRQRLCVALSSKDGTLLGFRSGGGAKSVLRQGDVTWAVMHEGEETRYELAIPWRALDASLTGPCQNGFVCFGVSVSDIDRSPSGQLTTRTELDALGGMSWTNQDGFGMLELK
jgi:hypothetical protein